jgi:hypothetical protein
MKLEEHILKMLVIIHLTVFITTKARIYKIILPLVLYGSETWLLALEERNYRCVKTLQESNRT